MMDIRTASRLEREAQLRGAHQPTPTRPTSLESLREAEHLYLQPVQYPAATDNPRDANQLHPVRFSPWPVTMVRDLEVRRAREGGHGPIVSFDLSHLSLTDQISPRAWRESAHLGSNAISIVHFTRENARRQASASIMHDRDTRLTEVESLQDIKEAFWLLSLIRRRYWPFDSSLESLGWYLLKTNWLRAYCHTEKQQAYICSNFIDFCLRTNATRHSRLEAPLDVRQLTLECTNFLVDNRLLSPVTSNMSDQSSVTRPSRPVPVSIEEQKRYLCYRFNSPKGCSQPFDPATNKCTSSSGIRRFHGCTAMAGKNRVCGGKHPSMQHNQTTTTTTASTTSSR